MMRSRSTMGMFAIAAMMMGMSNTSIPGERGSSMHFETDEEKERRRKYAESTLKRAKGLQEFYYPGRSEPIWAILPISVAIDQE